MKLGYRPQISNSIAKLIEEYGGYAKLANRLKISRASVHAWTVNGDIPMRRIREVSRILNVEPHTLSKHTEILFPGTNT